MHQAQEQTARKPEENIQPTRFLPQISISEGRNHLPLDQPAFGKIAIVLDRSTNIIHLLERLNPDWTGYVTDIVTETGDNNILNAIPRATMKLERDVPGCRHRNIQMKREIGAPSFVGGASAYFDGEKLYVHDFSGEFGEVSKSALVLCLGERSEILQCGFYVSRGNILSTEALVRIHFETEAGQMLRDLSNRDLMEKWQKIEDPKII